MQSTSFNRRKKSHENPSNLSQPCAENDEKVTLFEVIPDTLEESLRQVLSKEDNVRLDHSSTFRKSASGNLHIGNKCLEEEQSINVNLGLVFLHQDSLFDPGLNKFITIPDSIKKVFLCNSALCFSLHLLVKPDCTPSYSRCNVQY